MMRQPVGVGVECGVAQRAVLEHHRERVRRARRLRGKQRRQGRRRGTPRNACAVSFQRPQDGVALGGVQDRQVAERLRGIRDRGLQQPDQAAADRLHIRSLEQVGPVVEPQLQRSPGCTIRASG